MNRQGLFRVSCYAFLTFLLARSATDSIAKVKGARYFDLSADETWGPQRLTAEGETQLRSFLNAGELPGLRWPNFGNYQAEVKEFYESLGNTLPWIRGSKPTPQARAIIQLLKSAETKGLNPEDYDGPRWDARLAGLEQSRPPSEYDFVRFDIALTVSAMRCISDLHIGRVNPHRFHLELAIDNKKLDLSEFLQQKLVDAQDINAAIGAVEPPFPSYRRTMSALNAYLELARRYDGGSLPVPLKAVKPGDSYAGVPQLVRFLELLGDLPMGGRKLEPEMTYQGALVNAVKHFQERHGLESSGELDAQTMKELNTPLSRRVVQLQLTLERWRWLPHEFERPPIVVNIPEFRLRAINEEYHWVLSMKVVVGRAYRSETPVFASEIRSVIFRPYWNVPLAIQQSELVSEIENNPAYLAANSYEVVDSSGQVVSDSSIDDEMKERLRSGQLTLRQKPGPDNALGLIKFDLPNPYDVYLHGTPATQLFSRSRRDFSHGCIRVEDPVALAVWVLRDKPEWGADRIRFAMNGDETLRVNLEKPIPVLVVYGTAVVLEDGEVRFFEDIYGHDAAQEKALNKN